MMQPAADVVRSMLDEVRETMPSEASDWPLSVALLSPQGRIVAQEQPPPLYGTVLESVAQSKAHSAQSEWSAGRLHLSNDPYTGGLGLDAIVMIAPVLAGTNIAGLAGAVLGVADIGAMRPDIFAFGRQIIHEGVRLQALDFFLEDGQLPDLLWKFLEANTRAAAVTVPTLEALIAALMRVPIFDLPNEVADTRLPVFAQGRGTAVHRYGARISLEISFGAGVLRVVVEPTPMDPGGLNCALEATRAGILAGLAEAASTAPWRLGRRVEILVPTGSRFNPAYPSAVNMTGEGAWLAYRATMDALGRKPALSEHDFAQARAVPMLP